MRRADVTESARSRPAGPTLVAAVVAALGGRYSTEMGIDVDRGDDDVERWFLAASLFGHRISASTVVRTHAALDRAGIRVIGDAASVSWGKVVDVLDAGGFVRYDFSTATRLQELAAVVADRFGGRIAGLGRTVTDPAALEAVLDGLPGWGETTIRVFLRELRGRWPAARPPFDPRAGWSSEHLGLLVPRAAADPRRLGWLERLARPAGLDVRDVETALVRLTLAHARRAAGCPGGAACVTLRR